MVHEQTEVIMDLQNTILNSVAEMVEFRDNTGPGHIQRTQSYVKLLVEKLIAEKVYPYETSEWDLSLLISSVQFHDLGKIGLRDSVLNKTGRYTPEEFDHSKIHTTYGVELIEQIVEGNVQHAFLKVSVKKFFTYAKHFAGAHHEKWDGSGYPAGLQGETIPLEGRLMAIADVYDALISDRPYKAAVSHAEAKKMIVDGKSTHFDPVLVDVFEDLAEDFARIAKSHGIT
jgi:putative two-component system response regulator